MNRKLLATICALALVIGGVTGTGAQKNEYSVDSNNVLIGGSLTESITITASLAGASSANTSGNEAAGIMQLLTYEMSFDNRLVENAPFSATVVSEAIQTLGDGTRIAQRSEGRLYRDSQGRTRNERSFRVNETGEAKQVITILDPVVGVSYTLDPEIHSARKAVSFRKPVPAPAPKPNVTAPRQENSPNELSPGAPIKKIQPVYPPIAKAARASGVVLVAVLVDETGTIAEASVVSGHPLLQDVALQAAQGWKFKPTELRGKPVKFRAALNFNFTLTGDEAAPAAAAGTSAKHTLKTEKLPPQIIESIACEGERKITTLPTGAIGNDRPIETVTETWYAPELRMMILSKRRDPRFGESIYRVTNLTRTEPEAELFQIPPDYTIHVIKK